MSRPLIERRRRPNAHPARLFLRLFRHYRYVLIGLAVLGLGASLAESVGISLAVMLLGSLFRATAVSVGGGGFLGHLYGMTVKLAGASTAVVGVLIFGLVVAKAGLNLAYGIGASWLRHTLSDEVRQKIHNEYMDLPFDQLMRRDRSELLDILSAESWSVADSCFTLTRMSVNISAIIVFGVFVFAISWKIAVVAALGGLIISTAVGYFGRSSKQLGEKVMRQNMALTDTMLSDIQGMRTIRAFATEDIKKAHFRRISGEARALFMRIDRLYAWLSPLNEISFIAMLGGLLWLSTVIGVAVTSTLTAVLLLYRLQPHLRELESNRLGLVSYGASLNIVKEILDPRDKRYPPQGTIPLTNLSDGVAFENVSFGFPGAARPVISGANFKIKFGGVTALAGPSGVGKTTIVNLLLRLYQPTAGVIRVGGVPLNEIQRKSWLARIAVAGQDVELITGTILENISTADPSASLDRITDVARTAGILEFIQGLPEGMNTRVGDRGISVSGGQRQRIGLARALLRDPDILILDEALNAVEAELELAVYNRLLARYSGRTIILITHRAQGLPSVDHSISLA